MLAQRIPRECPRRSAIGRARCVAVQGEAAGQGVLSRAGLRDGTLDGRRLQGERREGWRQHGRRGVRSARCQGLHAVFRPGARGATAGALHLGRRQRHRPAAQPDAGVRPAQQPHPGRRIGHRDVAEHRGDRQGRRRLRNRRRLFDGDRLAREQEIRRRLQGGVQGRSRSLRRRFLRLDLCLQGRGREGQVDRDRQGARGTARSEVDDPARREDHPRRRPPGGPDNVRGARHQRPVQDRRRRSAATDAVGADACTRF